MDHLVRDLSATARVLDLGSGGGSFDYSSTSSGVVAVDIAFPTPVQGALGQVCASSSALPLSDGSVDLVVSNHTLEHFGELDCALTEIDRVLKAEGTLWVAVPDSSCLDDILYRWVFEGGGHVNPFTLASLISTVEARTGLRAREFKRLFSGFVYLSPPDPEKLAHFPPRARFLGIVPPALLRFGLRWLNYLTRLCDGWLSTRFSQYGWGVVFQKSMEPVQMDELECDVNVCFRCGTGHPDSTLASVVSRKLLWRTFSCSVCAEKNLYFDPLRIVSSKPSQAVKR